MTWHYKLAGIHVHVRVFCNGALCGKLTFRKEEFNNIMNNAGTLIQFRGEE